MEKINVAKLLKDCPKGMELDCTMFDNVVFDCISTEPNTHPIYIKVKNCDFITQLTEYGQYMDVEDAKCVIFPKGKTTWEGFQKPYINGDIVYTNGGNVAILGNKIEEYSAGFYSHCGLFYNEFDFDVVVSPERLATEKEKEKLFQAVKENGYKWNPETKTLEKLIKSKFKIGDKILKKNGVCVPILITKVSDEFYYSNTESSVGVLSISEQDDYELVPNKFDINTLVPFESRVLVRHNRDNKWCGSFFSHIDEDFHSHCNKYVTTSGKSYPYCIPYEGNEHLIGKTGDCDEYFKTWKK